MEAMTGGTGFSEVGVCDRVDEHASAGQGVLPELDAGCDVHAERSRRGAWNGLHDHRIGDKPSDVRYEWVPCRASCMLQAPEAGLEVELHPATRRR
jgi:hypothetical protein